MVSAIFGISALLAFGYGAIWVARPVSDLRSGLKTGATFGLIIIAMFWDLPLWATALAFGALGDWFLSREPEAGLLPGLIAFTIGHCIYLWILWPLAGPAPIVGVGILIVLSFVVMVRLWGELGILRIPVAFYTAISFVLGCFALGLPQEALILTAGVLSFILSDVILAFELFVMKEDTLLKRIACRAVWVFYWGGQAAILYGASALT